MEKITILIADDHTLVRETWSFILNTDARFKVIAESGSGEDAVELAKQLRPQVVIMDINLPGMNGIEATRKIRQAFPHIQVIGLSMHNDSRFAEEMVQAGAKALIPKDIPPDRLFEQIRSVREPAT